MADQMLGDPLNLGGESIWPREEDGWNSGSTPRSLDLSMLWQVLEKHKKIMQEKEDGGHKINTTWELVLVQGVLISVLVLISLMWAFCCKRRCFSSPDNDAPSVAAALRKLSMSKDLPPSYSSRSLHTLGISVDDHLNPPPEYLELFKDDLQYLDLEAGHSRMAKLSFCGPEGGPPRLARLSVASCASCSNESPVIVPVLDKQDRRASSTSSTSSSGLTSRKSSRPSSRNSKVSFSEDVACSNGSVRRLSREQSLSSLMSVATNSRKSSSSSSGGGSRKSSLISKVQEAKRKMGSTSSNNSDSFINQLDDELRERLENIGDPVDIERQAERAARVCDIIHEEK